MNSKLVLNYFSGGIRTVPFLAISSYLNTTDHTDVKIVILTFATAATDYPSAETIISQWTMISNPIFVQKTPDLGQRLVNIATQFRKTKFVTFTTLRQMPARSCKTHVANVWNRLLRLGFIRTQKSSLSNILTVISSSVISVKRTIQKPQGIQHMKKVLSLRLLLKGFILTDHHSTILCYF